MYCKNCGAKIGEGDKFCGNCGTPVTYDKKNEQPIQKPVRQPAQKPDKGTAKKHDPKKRRNMIIAAVIALVVIGGGMAALVANMSDGYSAECKAKLETARQYVKEGNLDGAEATYLDIIKHEPDKPTAYVEVAEKVYAKQERYSEAENILKEGEKKTGGSNEIQQSLEKIVKKQSEGNQWKAAYLELLKDEENEYDIRLYENPIFDDGEPMDFLGGRKGTALCDLNEDNIPELLFLTYDAFDEDEDGYYYEKLHVYTFTNGKAKELKYEWTSATCFHYGDDDGSDRDYYEHDGLCADNSYKTVGYVVYKEKGVKGFSIHSMYEDDWILENTTNRYAMNTSNDLERTNVFSNCIDYDDTADRTLIEYADNYEECSKTQYEKQITSSTDNIETVIIRFFPSYAEDELERVGCSTEIWEATKDKDISLSYDQMIKKLTASDSEKNAGDDSQESKEGKIMEQVLDAYSKKDFAEAEKLSAQLPKKAKEMKVSEAEYEAYQGIYNDLYEQGEIDAYAVSFITDVDNDGKSEYLIQTGHGEAEYALNVYQYRDGKTSKIGSVGFGESSLHSYPDHNGVILQFAHMGYEMITIVSIEGGKLKSEQLLKDEREVRSSEEYLQLGLSAMPADY